MNRLINLLCLSFFSFSLCFCTNKEDQNVTQKIVAESDLNRNLSRDQKLKPSVKPQPKWLFIGDSLTAGYGIEAQSAYVSLLEDMIEVQELVDSKTGLVPKLVNAGVSGDTSSGALRRLSWLLADQPTRIFLCIGANDGLRGQPLELLKNNLSDLSTIIKSKGIELILMGMRIPPNYGEEYSHSFAKVYERVANEHNLALYPFLLANVAGHNHLNQTDGIHPNREGHQLIAKQLVTYLKKADILSVKVSQK